MAQNDKIQLFEDKRIRTAWDEEIVQLKMTAPDGKKRFTDMADTEQLLRIIQSIPSPKAEPFKLWLARVGRERIEETIDPELTIERALETYLKKGYTRGWINQRLQAIQVRKELTDDGMPAVYRKAWSMQYLPMRYPVHGRECLHDNTRTSRA